MTRRAQTFVIACGIASAVAACSTDGLDPEVGDTQQAGIIANGIIANGIIANGIIANGIIANGLDPSQMSPQQSAALEDPGPAGDAARLFVQYAVGCAFTPQQSFNFSWTDSSGVVHNESYPGGMGLAPYWATGPLDVTGQQWVSACLAARVNALGVHVTLSLRGTHPGLAVSQAERQNYNTREAVWFGNIFTANPTVYACYDPLNIVPADLDNRVCSQPQLGIYDCGIIHVLGPCFDVNALHVALISLGYCPYVDPSLGYMYGCTPTHSGPAFPSITSFLANVL